MQVISTTKSWLNKLGIQTRKGKPATVRLRLSGTGAGGAAHARAAKGADHRFLRYPSSWFAILWPRDGGRSPSNPCLASTLDRSCQLARPFLIDEDDLLLNGVDGGVGELFCCFRQLGSWMGRMGRADSRIMSEGVRLTSHLPRWRGIPSSRTGLHPRSCHTTAKPSWRGGLRGDDESQMVEEEATSRNKIWNVACQGHRAPAQAFRSF